MRNPEKSFNALICTCNHQAPSLRELRSVEDNRIRAQKMCAWNLSGEGTAGLIVSELLNRHTGRLFDPDGRQVMLFRDKPADVKRWDGLFSEDERRFINRYKERAGDTFRNCLQKRLVFPVMMMQFAIDIRECRLSGRCAAQ